MNIWSLTLLLFAQTEVFGAGSYPLEVISQTGELTALGNPITRLGTGPSINDAGRVAYTVEIEDGRQGIFVSGESRARSVLIEDLPVYPGTAFHRVSSEFYFGDAVQINNRNQIALRIKSHDGIFSVIVRLGIEVDDTRIVAKTYWDNSALFGSDLLSPFLGPFPYWWEGLSSQVTLSNTGRVVFSAIPRLAPLTKFIVTPQSTEAINHDFLSSYYHSGLLQVFLDGDELAPTLFPFVADNDRTVLRGGHSKHT